MGEPQHSSDVILARMQALHPKIIDLTLDRVWRLLERLGNPQDKLAPVIHIAGTNGKGSTLAMIRAGLEASGKKVNAYTSPHLVRFHERIYLGGAPISETELTALLDECDRANDGAGITYFEITTCAAILAFARHPADFTLLEVGLGGRLDATNVIEKPALSVITPVSLDHQSFLGDTVEEIAAEKAGIIKRGVPVVVSRQSEPASDVIEARAMQLGAPILAYGQHWHASAERDGMVYQDENGLLDLPRPNLPGDHQIENAGTALSALRFLGFDAQACLGAVTHAKWPARMQRLTKGPLAERIGAHGGELWLDGGHNPAAGDAISALLRQLPQRPTYLICAMLNTKDIVGYLRPLAGVAAHLHAISIPGEPNTLSADEVTEVATRVGLSASSESGLEAAVNQILSQSPSARILICGSLYLAGHVLRDNG